MERVIFLLLIIILVACSKNEDQKEPIIIRSDLVNAEIVIVDETESVPIANEGNIVRSEKGEEKIEWGSTVYNTVINDDNVNIYNYPSINSQIRQTVDKNTNIRIFATSWNEENIDGHIGYWHLIQFNMDEYTRTGAFYLGWVFSKYIEIGPVTPSYLQVIEMFPQEENRQQRLRASFQINGEEQIITLYLNKLEHQDFYTFAFDHQFYDYTSRTDPFHYSNIPGTYAWFPETNELRHISHIGTDMESAWGIVTDDFRYLLTDGGTSPPPRGVTVYRLEDMEVIYSGMYYDINLQGNTIEVISWLNNYSLANNYISTDALDFAEEFQVQNPVPDDMLEDGMELWQGIDIIVIHELNLDTGVKNIIGARYIYVQ